MDGPASAVTPAAQPWAVGEAQERELRRLVESLAVGVSEAETVVQVLEASLSALGRWSGWPAGQAVLVGTEGPDSDAQSVWWSREPGRYRDLRTVHAGGSRPDGLSLGETVPGGAAVEPLELTAVQDRPGIGPLLEHGLELACALRLQTGTQPLGALHLYSPSPAPSVGPLAEVAETVTALVSGAVDRLRRRAARDRELAQRLEDVRWHDPLTGLANRRLFASRLDRALERARRHTWSTTVLAVDLDDFSAVNERFGPEVGDRVLVSVAQRLQAAVRPYDELAGPSDATARAGSDEFLVFCENVDHVGAASIAERVLAELAVPVVHAGEDLGVTATVGIAVGGAEASAPALIADAQAARRHARRSGSATYGFFVESLREATRVRTARRRELAHALDVRQFTLHYQPQVLVATGRVLGAEALVRWQHPERGLVPPADFISLAETTGLIVPLGAWVLQEACQEAARWRRERPGQPPAGVSVNVSARQFRADLVQTVRMALADSGLDPGALVLEVTESVVMDDVDHAVTVLRGLKDLGAAVSIDDFGTGYSSLAYLKRLPLDELKIDRSFVSGLGVDPEDTAIAAAVTAMAHALDLQVVAEGVETALQLDRLRALGCDVAQGYHFSPPVPAAALDELLLGRGSSWTAGEADASSVVLVADDTPEVRQLAVISLSTAGFDVHEAVDGRAALALAGQLRPDCLVLDVRMPHLTGYEVCRAVRADPLLASCTVVMLTSGAAPEEKLAGYSAGADDYLVKPFTPRDLVTRVRHAMAARSTPPFGNTAG